MMLYDTTMLNSELELFIASGWWIGWSDLRGLWFDFRTSCSLRTRKRWICLWWWETDNAFWCYCITQAPVPPRCWYAKRTQTLQLWTPQHTLLSFCCYCCGALRMHAPRMPCLPVRRREICHCQVSMCAGMLCVWLKVWQLAWCEKKHQWILLINCWQLVCYFRPTSESTGDVCSNKTATFITGQVNLNLMDLSSHNVLLVGLQHAARWATNNHREISFLNAEESYRASSCMYNTSNCCF